MKLLIMFFVFFISTAQANKWSDQEQYHLTMLETTIYENEASFKDGSDQYFIYYSLVSEATQEDKTNASLYIHITKNKKLYKTSAVIEILTKAKIFKFNLIEYNAPISIGIASTYRTSFHFDFSYKTMVKLRLDKLKRTIDLPIIYSRRH